MEIGATYVLAFNHSKPVTPSDTVDNTVGAVGLHNATATGGTVKVAYMNGATDTLYLNGGVFLAVTDVRRVYSTGTTVTTVCALY